MGRLWGIVHKHESMGHGPRARARAYTRSVEAATRLQHSLEVLPFVVTLSGQMGADAEAFIAENDGLAGGQLSVWEC